MKTVFLKLKYKNGNDYDAKHYWEDRFKKYKLNIKGPGYEGASVSDNELRYLKVLETFMKFWRIHHSEKSIPKTLEIGVGTGIITGALQKLGVTDYTGYDITDILFNELKVKFPFYNFLRADVTENQFEGKYDAIVIIDVIQHIVTTEKLNSAFRNLDKCLNKNGLIFISPLTNRTYKMQFYEHSWSLRSIDQLSNYEILGESEWTKGYSKLVVLRKL